MPAVSAILSQALRSELCCKAHRVHSANAGEMKTQQDVKKSDTFSW